MKSSLVPAILEQSFKDIVAKAHRAEDVTNTVQIDVVDGIYASNITWPFTALQDTSDATKKETLLTKELQQLYTMRTAIELDLMIQNPEDTLGVWLVTDAVRFIIHRMSTKYLTYCINRIKEGNHEVYIGLTSDDTLIGIEPMIELIDGVQCMGIAQIGKQGEPYDERIETLIADIRNAYPKLPIQVDGGVSVQTIPRLLEAGATQFAVGSALFKGDVEQNFSDLSSTTQQTV